DGEPIKGYYPPVVTEAEFYKAGAGTTHQKRGRIGETVSNLFGGLLYNARGGTYRAGVGMPATARQGGPPTRLLMASEGVDGRGGSRHSFPLETFERAILYRLSEIDIAEVVGTANKPDATTDVLQAELAWVRGRQAELSAELLKGSIPAIAQ